MGLVLEPLTELMDIWAGLTRYSLKCTQEGVIVGVISVSMGSIKLKDLPPDELEDIGKIEFDDIPVLLLGQIGTHVCHRRHGVCREMCDFGVSIAARLSEEIGCRYVALATKQEKVPIYESCGFKRKTLEKKRVVMAQRV